MLTTSAAFDEAIVKDSMRVIPRVRWWQSWNHLIDTTTVSLTAGTSSDEELYPVDSILNERHQDHSGSAYAYTGEAYTSTDPRYGFRLAPADSEINPIFIATDRTAGTGSTTNTACQVQVEYGESLPTNTIEVQMETLRTASESGEFFTPIITVSVLSGGTWTAVASTVQLSAASEGRYVLYYNGSSWTTTENFSNVTDIEGVRLTIHDTPTNPWLPKIRYVGAHRVLDVTDDIIDFNVTKYENEQLSYMPFGEPNANTATLNLDNTGQTYGFRALSVDPFRDDLDMRVDIELGLDLTYAGTGSGIEFLPVGTYYVDSLGYNTDLTLSLSMSDMSKFLQRKFLDDSFWEGKSLKYVIKDVLARTGFGAGNAEFIFGVAENESESAKMNYTWFNDETLLWDALVGLVKSEIGTLFITEDNKYRFTDRKFLDIKIEEGVQWTIDADVDLESAQQDISVMANDIKVNWIDVGKNIDPRGMLTFTNIQTSGGAIEQGFTTTGPIEISGVLWEPGNTLVLNAATLYETMTASQEFIRITKTAGQTFPTSGAANIEGEYVSWTGKTVETDYVELTGVTRGERGTAAAQHKNGDGQVADIKLQQKTFAPAGETSTVTGGYVNGVFDVEQICDGNRENVFTAWRPFGNFINPDQDYAYGTQMTFRNLTDDGLNDTAKDNLGGLFFHANETMWSGDDTDFNGYWVQINSLTHIAETDFVSGTLVVFRTTTGDISEQYVMPPEASGGFFAEIVDDDIPVAIDVYWESSAEIFTVYTNDNYVTSFTGSYASTGLGTTRRQGNMGVFIRGNTHAQFDYIYAGDRQRVESDRNIDYIYGGFKSHQGADIFTAAKFIEFGAIVHELKSFNVDHQVYPNRWARIFHTNQREAQILNQNHTAFSSQFEIINTSRSPAVLVGNDQTSYNNNLGANHDFFVYGSTVIERESGTVSVRDKNSVRKRGVSSVEIDNPWIHSEDQAQRIADWIRDNWAEPSDFYTIEWFPNWALQAGDRVDVSFEEKGF